MRVGTHPGAHFFTIGQRGLNVGGHVEPVFVIGKDMTQNTLYVGESERHPGLHRMGLSMAPQDVHWFAPISHPMLDSHCGSSPSLSATLATSDADFEAGAPATLVFDAPQSGTASGSSPHGTTPKPEKSARERGHRLTFNQELRFKAGPSTNGCAQAHCG